MSGEKKEGSGLLISAEIYNTCLENLQNELKKQNIDVSTTSITTIIRLAMEIVEASILKGEAQRELVIKIVKKIIIKAPINDAKVKAVLDMYWPIIGQVVDLVVSASKGELNINAASKVTAVTAAAAAPAAAACCSSFMKKMC